MTVLLNSILSLSKWQIKFATRNQERSNGTVNKVAVVNQEKRQSKREKEEDENKHVL